MKSNVSKFTKYAYLVGSSRNDEVTTFHLTSVEQETNNF